MDTTDYIDDCHCAAHAVTRRFRVRGHVAERTTPFQHICIVDLHVFGRALFLDGFPQSAEADEHIYHEALVLPALAALSQQGGPRRVFIAGGGEGATLRELLRSPDLQAVCMVDIDPAMIAEARVHLGSWHRGAFDDRRVQLLHADARQVLERDDRRYDLIVLDLSDPAPDSPSATLFTEDFYRTCRSRLAPDGLLAVQSHMASAVEHGAFVSSARALRSVFRYALPYTADVPFFGGAWGFVLAGCGDGLAGFAHADVDTALERLGGGPRQFYDSESHRHMFALPRVLRRALDDPAVGRVMPGRRPARAHAVAPAASSSVEST